MAKDPAVLFYTSDYLSGTAFFTFEQKGVYMDLLCLQHQNGHIPEDVMNKYIGVKESPVWDKFKKDDKGLWFQPRMEEETIKRKNYSESRRNNVKKRYESTLEETQEPTYVGGMKPHMDNGNGNINKDISKKTIEDRMKDFELEVMLFKGVFPETMLNAFYEYWSEPNPSKTKMKKELNKTWDTKRRLNTWDRNQKSFSKQPVEKQVQKFEPSDDIIKMTQILRENKIGKS